jgi:hypothetical protein
VTLYGAGFLQVFYCYFYYYDDNFYSYYYDHYFYYFYFYYSYFYFYFYFYVYFYVYFYYYYDHYHYYYYYAVQTCGVPNGGRPRHTARSRFESDPWRIYLIVQMVARVLPPATPPLLLLLLILLLLLLLLQYYYYYYYSTTTTTTCGLWGAPQLVPAAHAGWRPLRTPAGNSLMEDFCGFETDQYRLVCS